MILAHVMGLPVEETIGSIAPLVGVGATVAGVQMGMLRRRLGRRRGTGG
jgi:hypothetical protein